MIVFPGAVIGGAPFEAAAFTWRYNDGGVTSSSDSWATVPVGDVALGRNEKWAIGCVVFEGGSNPNVSLSSISVGGVTGTVIYDVTVTTATTLRVQYIIFVADISSLSGNITVSYTKNKSYFTRWFHLVTAVNLDCSAQIDNNADGGGGIANISLDCPAGGGIIAFGSYGYSGGGTPTTVDFDNLTTLNYSDSNIGWSVGAETFASAQTALTVDFDPVPNSAQCSAAALSFAAVT